MVDVDLDEDDYKVIMGWYEMCFAGKDSIKERDVEVLHKLMIMCKAILEDLKKFTSNNDRDQ